MDASCVVAALLHDTVEDTPLTFGEIEETFGEEVCTLVKGVTRVSKLPDDKLGELERMGFGSLCRESGDLLQLLESCAGDWRIAVLKVADRLHNMRTLGAMKPHKRARKAKETARVFVPLAHYLGAHSAGDELAELSARHHADDQPQHRLWASRLSHAARYFDLGIDRNSLQLASGPPVSAGTSRQRMRRLILQLDETDAESARNLVLRLRPLHERMARHQLVRMRDASTVSCSDDEGDVDGPMIIRSPTDSL